MTKTSFRDEMGNNKRSSILLAIVVSLILFFLIYFIIFFLVPELVLIAVPLSVISILIYTYSSYRFGDSVVLSSTNAKPAEGREYQYLRDTVEGLSIHNRKRRSKRICDRTKSRECQYRSNYRSC
jgi:ABC-type bacteriocin/lantibiotic exporter with double-glycine peptidase domain